MAQVKIRSLREAESRVEHTSKARTILQHAHESAEGFLESFAAVRDLRGAGRGTTTDEEQDLLRAILVFAAAGLDSTIKQLFRDALPQLVRQDSMVKKELQSFVTRQIRGLDGSEESPAGSKFLAKILTAEGQLDELVELYVNDLTGSSLQSYGQLARAVRALGLEERTVGVDEKKLQHIFDVRNKMIHELDINLDAAKRNRETRNRNSMVNESNALLEVGDKILTAVEAKISPPMKAKAASSQPTRRPEPH